MDDQIPEEVKEERMDQIMRGQLEISLENNRDLVGFTLEVIIDEEDEDGSYIGRSRYDAPDVDGLFFLESDRELMTGDMVMALVKESRGYDLFGEMINE